jgi:hypothetical protein
MTDSSVDVAHILLIVTLVVMCCWLGSLSGELYRFKNRVRAQLALLGATARQEPTSSVDLDSASVIERI